MGGESLFPWALRGKPQACLLFLPVRSLTGRNCTRSHRRGPLRPCGGGCLGRLSKRASAVSLHEMEGPHWQELHPQSSERAIAVNMPIPATPATTIPATRARSIQSPAAASACFPSGSLLPLLAAAPACFFSLSSPSLLGELAEAASRRTFRTSKAGANSTCRNASQQVV